MPKIYNSTGDSHYTHISIIDSEGALIRTIRPNVKGVIYDLDKTPSRPDLDKSKMTENDYQVEKTRFVEKEALYIEKNAQKIFKKLSSDPVEFTYKADQDLIEDFCKTIKEDYNPLSSSEKRQREKISSQIRKKYTEFSAKKQILNSIINSTDKGKVISRTENCFIRADISPEGIEEAKQIAYKLRSTDPKVREEAYNLKFEEILNYDIENVDLSSDQYIIDNFDKLSSLMTMGSEIKAILNEYQNMTGLDMTTEEYKPVFERMGAISLIADALRMKIDIMASPLYSQIRTDELLGLDNFSSASPTDSKGKDFDYYSFLYGNDEPNKPYDAAITQIQWFNGLFKDNPLMDFSRTPKERYEAFCASYWTTYNEVKPVQKEASVKAEVKSEPLEEMIDLDELDRQKQLKEEQRQKEKAAYDRLPKAIIDDEVLDEEIKTNNKIEQSGEPTVKLPDINQFRRKPIEEPEPEDEYGNDFATDEELSGIEDKEIPIDEIINDESEGIGEKTEGQEAEEDITEEKEEDIPEEIEEASENDTLESDSQQVGGIENNAEALSLDQKFLDEQEKILRQNIELIKQVIPDFKISEAEIKEIVSKERLDLRRQFEDYTEKSNAIKDKGIELPKAYQRSGFTVLKDIRNLENAEDNRQILDLLNDASEKGMQFKKELVASQLNHIKNLNRRKLTIGNKLTDMLKYSIDNMDTLEMGMEYQSSFSLLNSSMGLEVNENTLNNAKNIMDKGVVLGGVGRSLREVAISDSFFVLPFEKLNLTQLAILSSSKVNLVGVKKNELPILISSKATVGNINNYVEPSDHVYTANDLNVVKLPSINEIAEKSNTALTRLKDAKSVFSFTNSEEYNKLISSVEKLSRVANEKDITTNLGKKLMQSISEVKTDLNKYLSHVGQNVKNSTQELRRTASKELSDFLNPIDNQIQASLIAEKYMDDYNKEILDDIHGKGIDEATRKKELMFERGLAKTQELRQKETNLPDGFKKDLIKMAIGARENLTNFVGKDFNKEDAVKHMATLLVVKALEGNVSKMPDNKPSDELSNIIIDRKIQELVENPSFRKITEGLNSDMINGFLDVKGEETMIKNLVAETKKQDALDSIDKITSKTEIANKKIEEKPENNFDGKSFGGFNISH